MSRLFKLLLVISLGMLSSCGPVKLPIANQYQIKSYSAHKAASKPTGLTLLVTAPEAVAGYQTEAMLYVSKPYQLESFAKNAWVDSPANMLYPLLIQSIQHTNYFAAVSSSPYTQGADYRLDTQILRLEQNFLKQPSTLDFSIKVVLTRMSDNKTIASRVLSQSMPCLQNSPYGGVLAANRASFSLTASVAHFVVSHIKRH